MKHFWIALLLLCSIGLSSAGAEIVSRVAAVVNKDIITTNQLDRTLQEYLAKQKQQPSPAQLGALRQELLSRLIEEKLVQQQIEALNLQVAPEELESALLDVQQSNKLTRQELQEAIKAQGMDFDAYLDNLRQQILRYKLIGAEVRSKINIPEREVADYYRAHLEDYRLPPGVELSHMALPVPKKASEQELQHLLNVAEEALGRLQQGEGLEQVAASYRDNYGATSGELGRFAAGDLTPDFTEAIENVGIGAYSQPALIGDSIHLLRVDNRFESSVRQFDSVKDEIFQIISEQKTDARLKEWTKSLKSKSFIDIKL